MKSHPSGWPLVLALLLSQSAPVFADPAEKPAADAVAPANVVNIEHLCQHWIHSREEDAGGEQTYRALGSKEFPPSRFRMQYIFHKTGDCEVFFLDPADAHRFKPGKWRIEPKSPTVLHITGPDAPQSYQILELTKEVLRLTPVQQKEQQGQKADGSKGQEKHGPQNQKGDGSQGQKDDGPQGQRDDGQQGQRDDGQQNQKDDGQQQR